MVAVRTQCTPAAKVAGASSRPCRARRFDLGGLSRYPRFGSGPHHGRRGLSRQAVPDSRGILTIGFGTNIGEGITRREAEFLLRERLAVTYQTLTSNLPWLSDAPERQQSAILDMGYQLGPHGVLGFHGMLSALESGDCPAAKAAALDSAWARETPERAKRVTALLCED